MTMEDHICKLLQRSSKVRIPGFGTLVASYSPARIHPAQHLFQPPHKALSFDKGEIQDDGVLVMFVSVGEKISAGDARKKVDRFVETTVTALNSTGNCLMPGIGKFYFDIEKQLQFLPDDTNNFLLASYGLSDFISHPILRPENIRGYTPRQQQEKKKRRFIWFRF